MRILDNIANSYPISETKTRSSIDEYIGKKLREFREKVGLSLVECALRIGVSHQQIHKYELGQTKISPAILYKCCNLFSVTPNIFFEGYAGGNEGSNFLGHELTSSTTLKKITIFFLERSSEEQFFFRKMLEQYDSILNIFCIHSGDEFEKIIKKRVNETQVFLPDLIFLELNMPRMDGIATLKMIKQNPVLKHIPVIILTGSLERQDMLNAYKNYASGYIRKSFEYETMNHHLHLAISYWTEAVLLPGQPCQESYSLL